MQSKKPFIVVCMPNASTLEGQEEVLKRQA
jgi:hypothetical protein